jgi:hypothetical protein
MDKRKVKMSIIKRENGIGMALADTWGTPVIPAAGEGLFVITHSTPRGDVDQVTNEDEFNVDMATAVYPMEFPEASGSMTIRHYFEGLERLWAAFFGYYAAGTPPESGVVKHEFRWNPVIGSIFFTIGWEEGDETKIVQSAKIKSGKIYFDGGLKMDIAYGGDKVKVLSDSEGSLSSLSYPSDGKGIFKLLHTTVWANAQAGADFADGDILDVNGISIEPARGYESQPVTSGKDAIGEHLEPGTPLFTITLNFPKKSSQNESFISAHQLGTLKKLRIKMEGPVISGKASKYTLNIDVPMARISEAPEYSQDSPIPTSVKFTAMRAAAAPTGMAEVLPFAYLINEIAALTGYPAKPA